MREGRRPRRVSRRTRCLEMRTISARMRAREGNGTNWTIWRMSRRIRMGEVIGSDRAVGADHGAGPGRGRGVGEVIDARRMMNVERGWRVLKSRRSPNLSRSRFRRPESTWKSLVSLRIWAEICTLSNCPISCPLRRDRLTRILTRTKSTKRKRSTRKVVSV
uniref:(northern house mosquito) hypothetical protein n=1 Tax=Culex pipiens TaxID=7175 RepID=A0A8D8AWC9_CULPI